eukprot:9491937-Pyramimonas_sp.AAC.1
MKKRWLQLAGHRAQAAQCRGSCPAEGGPSIGAKASARLRLEVRHDCAAENVEPRRRCSGLLQIFTGIDLASRELAEVLPEVQETRPPAEARERSPGEFTLSRRAGFSQVVEEAHSVIPVRIVGQIHFESHILQNPHDEEGVGCATVEKNKNTAGM